MFKKVLSKQYHILISFVIILCLSGCININFENLFSRPIVVKRIDGKDKKKFYVMKVYSKKVEDSYLVNAKIEVVQGSSNSNYQELGVLELGVIGKAYSWQEVTDKFSTIEIKKAPDADGEWVYVGNERITSMYHLELDREF